MVDEFQDTNRQTELLDHRAGRGGDLFVVGDEFQSIYGFPTRTSPCSANAARPRRLSSRYGNHRSRPEVLAAVNELFAAEFGDEFQRLEPATGEGRRPSGTPSSCSSPTRRRRRTRASTGAAPRRGHVARRVRELVDAGVATPGADRPPLRRRDGRGVVRGGAAGGRAADLPRRGAQLLRPAAGRRPPRVPPPPPQPVRRRGASHRPRLAVRRGVERRLVLIRADAQRQPIFRGIERGIPGDLAEDDRRMVLAFRQRYERLLELSAHAPLELLCERILSEHDYDLAVLARRTASAGTRTSASSPAWPVRTRSPRRRPRGLRALHRGPGGRRRQGVRRGVRGRGRGCGPAPHDPCRQGPRVRRRGRRRRGPQPAAGVRHPRAERRALRVQGRLSRDGNPGRDGVVSRRQGAA